MVVHAITFYSTHLLAIVCATRRDMNSWKILYSEEFKDSVVLCSQAHYTLATSQYFRT